MNGKAIGSDVFSSGPTKLVILNEAERAVKRIIKAEVYNQGVKREGVEGSGVEQSSCDARVWAPATKRQNKMADVIVHYQRVEPKLYPPEGQPKSASDKFLANIFLILFL